MRIQIMGRLVKQIYLKMLIRHRAWPVCASKEDAEDLLKCLVDQDAGGISGIIFINPKYDLPIKSY